MKTSTKKPTGAKQALKRNADGRFAKKSATLPSTRRTRAAKPASAGISVEQASKNLRKASKALDSSKLLAKRGAARTTGTYRPRVSQRVMAPSSKRALEAVQVKAESYKVQLLALGVISGFGLFVAGLLTGWFMGVS